MQNRSFWLDLPKETLWYSPDGDAWTKLGKHYCWWAKDTRCWVVSRFTKPLKHWIKRPNRHG